MYRFLFFIFAFHFFSLIMFTFFFVIIKVLQSRKFSRLKLEQRKNSIYSPNFSQWESLYQIIYILYANSFYIPYFKNLYKIILMKYAQCCLIAIFMQYRLQIKYSFIPTWFIVFSMMVFDTKWIPKWEFSWCVGHMHLWMIH